MKEAVEELSDPKKGRKRLSSTRSEGDVVSSLRGRAEEAEESSGAIPIPMLTSTAETAQKAETAEEPLPLDDEESNSEDFVDDFESYCRQNDLDASLPTSRNLFKKERELFEKERKLFKKERKFHQERKKARLQLEEKEEARLQLEKKEREARLQLEEREEARLQLENKERETRLQLEKIERELVEMDREKAFNKMLSQMKEFANANDSTAKDATRSISIKRISSGIDVAQGGLSLTGLALLHPLSTVDWKKVCDAVGDWSLRDGDKKETVVQSFLEKLLAAIQEVSPDAKVHCRPKCSILTNKQTFIPDSSAVDPSSHNVHSSANVVFSHRAKEKKTSHLLSTSQLIFPIEFKPVGDFLKAIMQALGYLMRKMIDQLEMANLREKKYFWGFCLGSDGVVVTVGKISVNLENFEVKIAYSEDYVLHENNGSAPNNESPGVKIIRALIHTNTEELGHVAEYPLGDFLVSRVLGRGGFSTALAARHMSKEDSIPDVVIKRWTLELSLGTRAGKKAFFHMLNCECEALRSFASQSCAVLPQLVRNDWKVDDTTPYLPMRPLGEELSSDRFQKLSLQERADIVPNLIADLRDATEHALRAGYCHTDIRADNIVVVRGGEGEARYVLIDWGLARAPNDYMHKHCGGLLYFHDDLVMAKEEERLEKTPFKPSYDQQSIKYVAHAFAIRRNATERQEWDKKSGEKLITARREAFQRWIYEQSDIVREAMDFPIDEND